MMNDERDHVQLSDRSEHDHVQFSEYSRDPYLQELRDHIATEVLSRLLAAHIFRSYESICQDAYVIADLMLKAREQK